MVHTTYFIRFDKTKILERHLLKDGAWHFRSGFEAPLTTSGSKVYLFANKDEIFYVGKTSQKSVTSRFVSAFKASREQRISGFKGYEFKNHHTDSLLHVFTSADWNKSGPKKGTAHWVDDAELIEAEVCYLIRRKTGQWPKYQNEIHFGRFKEEHLQAAQKIVTAIRKRNTFLPKSPIPSNGLPIR